jgi:hypothetical protein
VVLRVQGCPVIGTANPGNVLIRREMQADSGRNDIFSRPVLSDKNGAQIRHGRMADAPEPHRLGRTDDPRVAADIPDVRRAIRR